jgi:heme-degrading monooxygenase HmoA
MHAGVTTLNMNPANLDQVRDQLEREDAPRFEQLDGFKGMTLLTDRQSGKTVAITFWESEDALRESEDAVGRSPARSRDRWGRGTAGRALRGHSRHHGLSRCLARPAARFDKPMQTVV